MRPFAAPDQDFMKTTSLGTFVFVLGLAAVCWVGLGYLGSNLPALLVTLLIAALYLVGAWELHRYRQATGSLQASLEVLDGAAPPALAQWLQGLHPSLRSAVQLRVEGGRAGLPTPALTPYLVGMLVLLGMLGTLLGMVLTLRGTGMALQTATDLQAVRDSLAAPVSGLGVAFGASIAGVGSSAALGLLSALVRRERIEAVQRLDAHIATTLRGHSQAHQREQALELMQAQAAAMPALVERLESMMAALEQQSQAAGERQARQQADFHARAEATYLELAQSVGQSLQASTAEGARLAGEALAPVAETTMAALTRQSEATHAALAQASERHLEAVSQRLSDTVQALEAGFSQRAEALEHRLAQRSQDLLAQLESRMQASSEAMATAWREGLSAQEASHQALAERNAQALEEAGERLARHATSVVQEIESAHARLQEQQAGREEQRMAAWRDSLATIGAELRAQWSTASEQARAHAAETIAEVSTLVQAAAEGPRAAAETIAELRQSLTESIKRDGAMLEERTRMLETLDTLLAAVNRASGEQREAIDALVTTSSDLLERVGARFDERIDAGNARIEQAGARLETGAEGVAALGQALQGAVQAFGESSAGLVERLQAIEEALERSLARSDEQLAYYVAQAREVVDLSVLSQRQIIGSLQQLAGTDGPGVEAGAEGAGAA